MRAHVHQSQNTRSRSGEPHFSSPQLQSEPVLDPIVFNSFRGMLAPAIVAQIYREFLEQTRVRLRNLTKITEAKKVGEVAHTIKGTAGMLGAHRIAACAAQLEHESFSPEMLHRMAEQLADACAALEAALGKEQVAL